MVSAAAVPFCEAEVGADIACCDVVNLLVAAFELMAENGKQSNCSASALKVAAVLSI